MKVLIVFASVFGLSLAQFPNGRILEPPVPALCAQRVIHERSPDGKGYWFSWRDQTTQGLKSLRKIEDTKWVKILWLFRQGRRLVSRKKLLQTTLHGLSFRWDIARERMDQATTRRWKRWECEEVQRPTWTENFKFKNSSVAEKCSGHEFQSASHFCLFVLCICVTSSKTCHSNIYLRIGNFFLLLVFCTFRPQICFYGRA